MNDKDGFLVWDDDFEKEMYTPEEIAENRMKAKIMCDLIAARKKKGITQKELEQLSGVKQPAIARMERGTASPTIDTLAKLLYPLGMTLQIVPLPENNSL